MFAPNDLSGVTLADLIPMSMEVGFQEEEHMQPVLISLIQAAMDAVACDCYLKDTHSSNQLEDPISRPDCTLIAAGHTAMWTQVVSVWEFKLGNSKTETETMFGQQIERCRYVLDAHDQRQFAVAVNFTMNSLEVMAVERQAHEYFKVSTTGPQPFSISNNSPGFRLLVNLLSTAKTDLGFVTSDLPDISQLEDHRFKVQLLHKKGTADLGSGSWVFSVLLESGMDAVLKLNNSPKEVCQQLLPVLAFARILALLSSADALCASFSCQCQSCKWLSCSCPCRSTHMLFSVMHRSGCWHVVLTHVSFVHAGQFLVYTEGQPSPGGDAGQRNLFLCRKSLAGHLTCACGCQAEMQ